ncbi:Lrp/AsnC family transcriptional regulator [Candidatus Woesearchaeota archaeon]|nr:Lrp/AsnC family transcriptional regulator [Candidatus Woesearchaeota archaeon]
MTEFACKTTEVDYIEKPKIDLKDKKILSVLSKNCRLAATQIGRLVGLSKEVVRYRIKNLEKKGLIRGYITIINPAKLGLQIFIVYLQMQNLSEAKEDEVIRKLIAHPATHYILKCLGKYDIIFDIFAKSINEFDAILRALLNEFRPYVKHYEISTILDVPKYAHLAESFSKGMIFGPIKHIGDSSFMKELQHLKIDYVQTPVNLDEKDLQIISLLSNNSALQLKQAEEKIRISGDSVKYRIKKLIEQNVIIGFFPIINLSMLGYHTHGILIELNNLAFEEKNKILNYLAAHPDVIFCLKTTGQYEIAINVSVTNNLHLNAFINELKQKFPEQINTIDIFLIIRDYKIAFLPG